MVKFLGVVDDKFSFEKLFVVERFEQKVSVVHNQWRIIVRSITNKCLLMQICWIIMSADLKLVYFNWLHFLSAFFAGYTLHKILINYKKA